MFNHPQLDFDLRFDTSCTAALTARLPESERDAVRPLWDAASWAAEAQRHRQQVMRAPLTRTFRGLLAVWIQRLVQ